MKVFRHEIDFSFINKIVSNIGVSGDSIVKGNDLPEKTVFTSVAELTEGVGQSICFYEQEKYYDDFSQSQAGLIFVPKDNNNIPKSGQIFWRVEKPYITFMFLVSQWLELEKKQKSFTISHLASIHPQTQIGEHVHIEPFAVIDEGSSIAEHTHIGSHVSIGKNVKVGQNCTIYPNVVIYEDCVIGNNVIIHSGSVIGADGFGYIPLNGVQIKVPQVGNVVIENDVEIGANTCIDRSTIGTTLIKTNVKLDNLVQIGHNCKVEEHTVICSQVGLAGNSHIGKSVYLAGQVGVAGHLKIEDNTLVGAQAGVASSLPTGKYFGSPAMSAFDQKKIYASMKDLPSIARYVKNKMKDENT